MNETLSQAWKALVGPFLIPVALAAGIEAFITMVSKVPFAALQWAALGFFLYVLIFPLLWQVDGLNVAFMETLEHESIHALMATLFFRRLKELRVDPPKSGSRTRSGVTIPFPGQTINFWIFLAPYFLPIATLLPIFLRPFSAGISRIVLDVVIGFTFAFHIVGVTREFGSFQTDIQRTTYVFAWSLIVIMNSLILILIVAVLAEDLALVTDYVQVTASRTLELFDAGRHFANQVIAGL